MTSTKTVLWSVPRSVSTAFERSIVQLSILLEAQASISSDGASGESMAVFHEPFGQPYYYSSEQVSTRFPINPTQPTFKNTLDTMLTSQSTHVFSKDMAYYVKNDVPGLVHTDMKHTFIIRHPSKTVPSLYLATFSAKDYEQTLAFDKTEVGFVELLQVYHYVKNTLGQTPIVIDSDDLLRDPEAYMQAYCKEVGLPFTKDMLVWEKGLVPKGWEDWEGWHDDAINSDGLKKRATPPSSISGETEKPKPSKYVKELTIPEVQEAIQENIAAYEEMVQYKLVL